jgi:predicted HTH domain antitoxin
MDNKQEQVIILSRITQIKDMQIFLLQEELKLKEELSRLKDLEEERTKV